MNKSPSFNYYKEVSNIIKTKGIKGIYTGLPMQAMSDIPSYAVYFAVYDILKQ